MLRTPGRSLCKKEYAKEDESKREEIGREEEWYRKKRRTVQQIMRCVDEKCMSPVKLFRASFRAPDMSFVM